MFPICGVGPANLILEIISKNMCNFNKMKEPQPLFTS